MKGSSDEVRTAKFDQETRVPLSDGRRASEWEGSRVRLREIILSTDRGHRSCDILHNVQYTSKHSEFDNSNV